MNMHFSKTTGGFYDVAVHGRNIPSDAVEITRGEYEALASARARGIVVADADGRPIAVEPYHPSLDEQKTALSINVDNHISAIYNTFTRFEREYVEREAAARAFKATDYIGDATIWVTAFANSAGMSDQAAADLIIAQADQLHAALESLAAIRMRKFQILSAADVDAAETLYTAIISDADDVAAEL